MQRWTQKYGGEKLIFWFQNTNYLVKDHHIVGFETSIRLNQFLVQIHQSRLYSHTKRWRNCLMVSWWIKKSLFFRSRISQHVVCRIPIFNIFPSPEVEKKHVKIFIINLKKKKMCEIQLCSSSSWWNYIQGWHLDWMRRNPPLGLLVNGNDRRGSAIVPTPIPIPILVRTITVEMLVVMIVN